MASDVDVANAALTELGQDRITGLDQSVERARCIREIFEEQRDATLADHPWSFAMTRAALSRLASAPAFGWDYQYQLPTDCLIVREIHPEGAYSVEDGKLLSNAEEVSVRYTRRVKDMNRTSAEFRLALAARIGANVAFKLTGSVTEKERMETLYRDRLRSAKGLNAQGSGTPRNPLPTRFIDARN